MGNSRRPTGTHMETEQALENTLVSVVVGTYNSAKFILDTLESVKAQTYQHLELIVSDDNSRDDTLSLCRQWLSVNEGRFVRTEIITTSENTGIVANANRAVKAVRGKWIKLLGGDDLLLPRCIESNMNLQARYPDNHLFVSKIISFDSETGRDLAVMPRHAIENNNGKEQLRGLLKGHYVKAPGVFISKFLVDKLGGFDPRYPMFEDDPFWIKANLAGYYFVENPEVLVRYRIHNQALSNAPGRFINPIFYPSFKSFKQEVVCPLLKRQGMYRDLFYIKGRLWLSDRILRKGNKLEAWQNAFERVAYKMLRLVAGT